MRHKIALCRSVIIIALISIALLPSPALGWRGYHHGSSVSFFYGSPGYGYPYYPYRPYYYPAYYYAPPPPVVYPAPAYAPSQYSYLDDSEYCREYTSKIRVDGRLATSHGTACQQPDGSWELQ